MSKLQEYIKENQFDSVEQLINYVDMKRKGKESVMRKLHDYYMGKTSVKERQLANINKVNNKLSNDFFGTIIDDKVGYMGSTIKTVLNLSDYSEEAYRDNINFISDWEAINNIEDVNSDSIKLSAICGYSARLLYNGREGARVRVIERPWEVAMVYDDDTGDPILGFWFYDKTRYVNGVEYLIKVVEIYDDETVTIYNNELSTWTFKSELCHLFDGVPLIVTVNNSERMGDYEKAVELIDAYDKALSDVSSEMEQLRLAYAILKGGSLDDETIEQMKQTGILVIDKEGSFEFSTKTLDTASIKLLLDELRRNIFSFCKSIDFSEVVSGDIRVLGWQTKLMPLENKCKIAERKMKVGLRYQYRLLCDYWRIHGYADINYRDINWKFTRNIPKDVAGEASTLSTLMSIVDKRTALEQVTFIDKPDEVMARMTTEATGKRPPAPKDPGTTKIDSLGKSVDTENKIGGLLN